MVSKILSRIFLATVFFGLISFFIGVNFNKPDPLSPYKSNTKKPLSIKPKQLKHYSEEEKMIREKLKLNLSKKEKSILAALHWLITFADKDENFEFVFADFMLLIHKMTISENRVNQKAIAKAIAEKSLARAKNNLQYIFNDDESSRWSFIGLFHILAHYPKFQDDYFAFYKKTFKSNLRLDFKAGDTNFEKAMATADYFSLFGYLVRTSFLHYYLIGAKNAKAPLPKDRFQDYLKKFEKFEYIKDHPIQTPQFRDLGYLVTHVVLVLTNYGERLIKDDINKHKAQDYIESTLEKVRKQLGDFDLLAEYVQCLKILNPSNDLRVKEFEQFIYSLQHPDGSWGSDMDFKMDPYAAIHPTGAALMALNQP